ncbi:MAG: hypothetical protein QM627_04615 [Luteolibacter sp.]
MGLSGNGVTVPSFGGFSNHFVIWSQGYLVLEIVVFLEFHLSLLRIGFLPQSRRGREGTQSRDDEWFLSEAKRWGAKAAERSAEFYFHLYEPLRDLGGFAVDRMRKASVDGAGFQKVQNEGSLDLEC